MDIKSCLLFCALFAFVSCAKVKVSQCPGKQFQNLEENVQLIPCKKLPCPLKKKTNQSVVVKFVPEKDISRLTNEVNADVLGLSLPFLGVDGSSVCDKLETEAGEKVSCPLKAGTTYVYKDSFPVHDFYPSINSKVHWALVSGKDYVTCFEVPIRII